MRYCKWRLITRLFYFIANDKINIILFKAKTFAKSIEMSCITLATFKKYVNKLKNS